MIQGIRLTHPGTEAPVGLCLVRPDAVPKLIRAAVYPPGAPGAPDILELIKGQKPLSVHREMGFEAPSDRWQQHAVGLWY